MQIFFNIVGFLKNETFSFFLLIRRRYSNYKFMKKSNASISLDANPTGGWEGSFVGENTRINSKFNLRNKNGNVYIGANCLIASRVTIIINKYDTNQEEISIKNMKFANVKINDNVLIGTGAVIMPGVEIGHGAVIGANSVVIKNVQPFSIVAGLPAKHIAFRKLNEK